MKSGKGGSSQCGYPYLEYESNEDISIDFHPKSCVVCVEIGTCGYLLTWIIFKQGGVKWTSFAPKNISKKMCYNVKKFLMDFCYMSLLIAYGSEKYGSSVKWLVVVELG